MLVSVKSVSYTPRASSCDRFYTSKALVRNSLTLLVLVLVGNFSYTHRARFSEEFFLQPLCEFYVHSS